MEAVSTNWLTRWRPINELCIELRERADLRTDLFGWAREKTMMLGRAEGSFNKSVDKMASYQ